jgi:hypothetical protein
MKSKKSIVDQIFASADKQAKWLIDHPEEWATISKQSPWVKLLKKDRKLPRHAKVISGVGLWESQQISKAMKRRKRK